MSEAQDRAFKLAVANVSVETDMLTDDVVALLRESIIHDWSTEEIVKRLFAVV